MIEGNLIRAHRIAARAVIALYEGFTVASLHLPREGETGVSVKFGQRPQGGLAWSHASLFLAGPCAAAICEKASLDLSDSSNAADRDHAITIISDTCADDPAKALQVCCNTTLRRLTSQWETVAAIADELLAARTLTGKRVAELHAEHFRRDANINADPICAPTQKVNFAPLGSTDPKLWMKFLDIQHAESFDQADPKQWRAIFDRLDAETN